MRFLKQFMSITLVVLLVISTVQPITATSKTSAEKLNQLGLLLNISEEELARDLTRDVGLTMILKALGYTQADADEYIDSSPFTDTQDWSKGWASLAYHLEITRGTSATTFEPSASLSEKEFVTFLLRALGYDSYESYQFTEELAIENGIIGINKTMDEKAYAKEEAANAMFNSLSATYLPENIPLVNLLLDKQLFSLNEAVNIGLKEGNLEILRVRVISDYEFQVVFNQAVDTSKITFAIEKSYASYETLATWNSGRNIATIVTADHMDSGTYKLVASYLSSQTLEYERDFKIDNNPTQDENGVGSFNILNPMTNNGRLYVNSINLIFDYQWLNEDGVEIMLPRHMANQDNINGVETIGDFVFTSSKSSVVNVDKIKVSSDGVMKFNTGSSSGIGVLKYRNSVSNESGQVVIAVYPESEINVVGVLPLSEVVTVGETAEHQVAAYDQFGALMDFDYIDGLVYKTSNVEVVPLNSMRLADNKFMYEGIIQGGAVLEVYTEDGDLLFTQYVIIEEVSEPARIIGIEMPKYFEASEKAYYKLSSEDIIVVDQYDRRYDLSDNNETVIIEHENTTDDVVEIGKNSFSYGTVTLKGRELVGKGSYTFSLEGLANSEKTIELETLDSDEILYYQIDNIEDLMAGDDNEQTLVLMGLTQGMESVVIGEDTIDFVTVSDDQLVTVDEDGNEIRVKGKENNEGGVVLLQVWSEGAVIAESIISVLEDE